MYYITHVACVLCSCYNMFHMYTILLRNTSTKHSPQHNTPPPHTIQQTSHAYSHHNTLHHTTLHHYITTHHYNTPPQMTSLYTHHTKHRPTNHPRNSTAETRMNRIGRLPRTRSTDFTDHGRKQQHWTTKLRARLHAVTNSLYVLTLRTEHARLSCQKSL